MRWMERQFPQSKTMTYPKALLADIDTSLGKRVLLCANSRQSLKQIENFFSELYHGRRLMARLDMENFILPKRGGLQLVIKINFAEHASFLSRICSLFVSPLPRLHCEQETTVTRYIFELDRNYLADCISKIESLRKFNMAGHQYLYESDISFVVSYGEYSPIAQGKMMQTQKFQQEGY